MCDYFFHFFFCVRQCLTEEQEHEYFVPKKMYIFPFECLDLCCSQYKSRKKMSGPEGVGMVWGKETQDLSLSIGTAYNGKPDRTYLSWYVGEGCKEFSGCPCVMGFAVVQCVRRCSRSLRPIFRDGKDRFAAFWVNVAQHRLP